MYKLSDAQGLAALEVHFEIAVQIGEQCARAADGVQALQPKFHNPKQLVYILMSVANGQKIDCGCCKFLFGHQVGQKLHRVCIFCLSWGVVTLNQEVAWHWQPLGGTNFLDMGQCAAQDFNEVTASMESILMAEEQAMTIAMDNSSCQYKLWTGSAIQATLW